MATKNEDGIWYLNTDGSDAIKDYPAIQRANADKLAYAHHLYYSGFTLHSSLKNTSSTLQRVGKSCMLIVEFKTPQFTTAPEIFSSRLSGDYRPRYATSFTLSGITDLLEPVVTAFIIDPDGYIKRNPKTPLTAEAYYAGTVVWLAS